MRKLMTTLAFALAAALSAAGAAQAKPIQILNVQLRSDARALQSDQSRFRQGMEGKDRVTTSPFSKATPAPARKHAPSSMVSVPMW